MAETFLEKTRDAASMTLRFLTFRARAEEFDQLGTRHLVFGLVCTWLVGIGRYWDSDRAEVLQHLGVGSVVYVFVLGLILWTLVLPFAPKNWSYLKVVTFITMTAPPAALYAIPVEMWFDLPTASMLNVQALLLVATWRVALLVFALRRMARLRWSEIIVSASLPLVAIVTVLSALNLEKAVFSVMAGLAPGAGTSADDAYATVLMMTISAWAVLPFIAIAWCVVVVRSHRRQQAEKGSAEPEVADETDEAA